MNTLEILEKAIKQAHQDYLDSHTKEIEIEGTYLRTTQLLYCPVKWKLEKEYEIPLDYKIPMYKGIAVHDWFESMLHKIDNNRFITEKLFYKKLIIDNNIYTIVGRIDAIDTQDNVLIEFKNYGRYRINKPTIDESIAERERVINKIINNPPQHYLEQLIIYSWLTELTRLQLVLFTDIYPIDIKFKLDTSDNVLKLIGEHNTLYAYNGPILLKNQYPDKPLISNTEEYVQQLVKRFNLSLMQKKPVWVWECNYCYFCKANICPICKEVKHEI